MGFVLYTGHNTKLIMNSKKSSIKYSRVESLMSKLLIFILFLQFILCVICSIANRINNSYLIIGLIGVVFISLAIVYFVITLRTVSDNVRKMKLKLYNLENTEN